MIPIWKHANTLWSSSHKIIIVKYAFHVIVTSRQGQNPPDINAPMNTAVSLENKQTSIFKELISQRDSDKISFFNALSQERIIQYNLERYMLDHE
jgi:hypothetical protein